MQKTKQIGYMLGFLAIFLWSWNVIISRFLADSVPPMQISFGRWFFAALAIVPFTAKDLWKDRAYLLKSWKVMLVLGITLAFQNNFVYMAGHTATAIDMSLIATTGPLFIVFFSWVWFKTSLSLRQILGFLVTFLGVLIVITHGSLLHITGFHFVIGDFWMLMDALFFGIYSVAQKGKPQTVSQTTLLSATVVLSLIILLPFFLLTLQEAPLSHLRTVDWSLFIYLGLLNSILGYLWWNMSIERIGNFQTSLMYYTIPLFSTVEAYFLLHEQIFESQIIGGLLVLGGILIANLHKKQPPHIERP